MRKIIFQDLGLVAYQESWDYQTELLEETIQIKFDNRKNGSKNATKNHFLFVEHPPVYTLGKSGDFDNLLLNKKQLEEKSITFYKINRGGDITFHGPGQIVGYPILDLEEVIILTIAEYGLVGKRSKGETGVWLDAGTPFARKICAFGVRASRWVTMHGLALNVNVNLGYFDHIIPCGIRGKAVTSMQAELGEEIPLEEVKEKIKKHFCKLFDAEIANS
jgi:lipoyl(octanoyl) transferase